MKEVRSAEVGAAGDLTLEGVPLLFDTPTTIYDPAGSYTEIIRRGALDHADLSDVCLRVEHDNTKIPLARTTAGTMRLEVRDDGLHMAASLAGKSPQAIDTYEAVKRGDLKNMSFAFTVEEGGSIFDPTTKTRTITAIRRLHECSIVAHAAYPTTSVEARSQMAEACEREQAMRMAEAAALRAMAKKIFER